MDKIIATKVQYTVKDSYVEENKKRISKVMKELRNLNNTFIKYQAFILEDGKSFMHLVLFKGESAKHLPSSLDSFKEFQTNLKLNLISPPTFEEFELIDSSYNLF